MKIGLRNGAAALICACMLTGCAVSEGASQAEETGETTARAVIEGIPAVTDDSADVQKPLPPIDSIEVLGDCFIAPDPKTDSELAEFFKSYDCEPGYIYFEEETFGRVALLLDKKCKSLAPHGWYQNEEYFWAVSEENEIIKVDKRKGTYEVLFTLDAPDGEIKRLQFSVIYYKYDPLQYEEGRLIYFSYTDGYQSYILILERDTDKYDILHCTDGLQNFYTVGYQEDMKAMGVSDEPYICDVCGYTGNYVIWENMYNEFYWYHPETGENTPLVLSKNTGVAAVFVLPEQGE